MWCPKCGAEYRETVSTCSDCGVQLVADGQRSAHEFTLPGQDLAEWAHSAGDDIFREGKSASLAVWRVTRWSALVLLAYATAVFLASIMLRACHSPALAGMTLGSVLVCSVYLLFRGRSLVSARTACSATCLLGFGLCAQYNVDAYMGLMGILVGSTGAIYVLTLWEQHVLGAKRGETAHYQEAVDAYKQAIRLKPDCAEAHYSLGVAYSKLDRWQGALDAFKQAIRLEPDYAEAHCNLGAAYDGLHRYQEAVDEYKEAIRLKPDDALTHYNLGVAYGELGRHQEELDAFKEAVRLNPSDAEAHDSLGRAYFFLGDRGAALEEYRILKDLDPSSSLLSRYARYHSGGNRRSSGLAGMAAAPRFTE